MVILNSSGSSGNCKSLTPAELQARLARGEPLLVLDVREYPEFASGRLGCARLVPLAQLDQAARAMDRSQPVVCLCRSGKRSAQAAAKLAALGFINVAQLEGGLLAWEQAGLPLTRDARAPWPLERQVRLAAGALVLTGLALSLRWSLAIALSWFIGAGLVFAAITDFCGMALLLAKAPWNKPSPQKWLGILPLPTGEGRGEGNRGLQQPAFHGKSDGEKGNRTRNSP